ncbi:hypothetical protein ATKI12_7640 [Kitasatospora sp. Ki12]
MRTTREHPFVNAPPAAPAIAIAPRALPLIEVPLSESIRPPTPLR